MLNRSIGSIDSWERITAGISFEAGIFSGAVRFCSACTIQVSIRQEGNAPKHHSYAVVNKEDYTEFSIQENQNEIVLSTAEAQVRIETAPFRVRLETKEGKLLSADDPAFGTSAIGHELCTYRSLQPGERFIGLGEKVGPVDRRGNAYVNYNTDKFAYSIEEDPLYLSTPFFIGIHEGGNYGLFLDNTFQSRFNFGASSQRFSWFSALNGEMDYYLIAGGSVQDIIREYAELTGFMPLPPRWALGYQQCRYSYYPDHEIKSLARTFREKSIPADVLYLDIHYMDEYKAFTFDENRFPNPKAMHDGLEKQGFRTVAIVDPGIKVQEGYGTYDRGIAKDVFAKLPDGERYAGEVWPSWSHFPDFTNSDTRDWWAEELKYYKDMGVSGIWNDMNEPAAWGQCLPELIQFENDGQPTSHAEARNVYGMQMARASLKGMAKHRPDERPFILTRAGFSGVQRYSAVWTGDNVSSDDHLMLSCRMLCSMGLTAIPFAGNDIGGFAGEASPALFARWMSVGVFQPMCRAHTQVNTRDAEPWSFGEEVEQIARNYISLRYRLMPYIYTAFYEASKTAMPVMRSLAIDYPMDSQIYDTRFENQYLFGPDLLICPARSTQELIEVYLPLGDWYDLYTDEHFAGGQSHVVKAPLHKLPVFVKAGAMIPWMSQTQHSSEQHDGVMHLHVYPGEGQREHYEDDGISHSHAEGAYILRSMKQSDNIMEWDTTHQGCASEFTALKVYLHGGRKAEGMELHGVEAQFTSENWRCIDPITGIDTFYADKGAELSADLEVINISNLPDKFSIKW